MGHLMIENYDKIPRHIIDFAYSKVKLYINNATDNSGLHCRFYVLKAGLLNKYTYYCGSDTVKIDWSACNKYNPKTIVSLQNRRRFWGYPKIRLM